MMVFKEVRKDYLKRALIIGAAIWLVAMTVMFFIVKTGVTRHVYDALTPDPEALTAAFTQAEAVGDAQSLKDLQQLLPGNIGGEDLECYGTSAIIDSTGAVLYADESYMMVSAGDAEYYVPLEGFLTNEEISVLESKFSAQPEYSNAMGSVGSDMTLNGVFNVEMVSELGFDGAELTGFIDGAVLYPKSLTAKNSDGETVTVFNCQRDYFADKAVTAVTLTSGELDLRSAGPKAQTSDNLAAVQKCSDKLLECAAAAAASSLTEKLGGYKVAVTGIDKYICVGVGHVETGLVFKSILLGIVSPILLYVVLAISAFVADSLARKKTGKKPEPRDE